MCVQRSHRRVGGIDSTVRLFTDRETFKDTISARSRGSVGRRSRVSMRTPIGFGSCTAIVDYVRASRNRHRHRSANNR